MHEPRPSWNATFVRRALEQDPSFDVSTLVQASKGLEVRAGTPPAALTADALSAFEAVVVGAPEELRASEVEALQDVRAAPGWRGGARPRSAAVRSVSRPHPVAAVRRSPGRECDRAAVMRVDIGVAAARVGDRRSPRGRAGKSGARGAGRTGSRSRRGPSCSSGPMAQAACSSRGRWTPGAFARRQTTGSGGSGGRGLPKAQRRRRRGVEVSVDPGSPSTRRGGDDSRAPPADRVRAGGARPHAATRGPRSTRRR